MADLIGGLLGYMRDPRRTQQMQALAGLLTSANERAKGFNALNRAATDEFLQTKDIYGPKAQQLAKTLADAYNPIGLTVFHGSPAKFSKFDRTKIGSGEGAQAYGYGHYVAESPAVAKEYRDKLTIGENYVNGELFDPYNPKHYLASALSENSGNVAEATDFLEFMVSRGGSKSVKDTAKSALELLKKGESPKFEYVKPSGSFYEIDLPDEQIARMLDWDKPLSQQPEEIRKPVVDFIQKNLSTELKSAQTLAKKYGDTFNAEDLSGRNLYQWLTENQKNSPEAAADMLRQAGIPGIRYLDEGSRGVNQTWVVNNPKFGGYDFPSLEEAQAFIKNNPQDKLELIEPQKTTSNFVVFPGNESLLTILKRNGGLLD